MINHREYQISDSVIDAMRMTDPEKYHAYLDGLARYTCARLEGLLEAIKINDNPLIHMILVMDVLPMASLAVKVCTLLAELDSKPDQEPKPEQPDTKPKPKYRCPHCKHDVPSNNVLDCPHCGHRIFGYIEEFTPKEG